MNIDGGWSDWQNNVTDDKGCWTASRECNNPPVCGAGLPCEGESTSQSHTDGGWGPWQNTTWEAGCVTGKRECNNPPQCGNGLDCQGDSTWKSVQCTPGKAFFVFCHGPPKITYNDINKSIYIIQTSKSFKISP